MRIIVISSPYDIPEDWDLGANPDWTPEYGEQVQAEYMQRMSEFHSVERCVGCGNPEAEGNHEYCFQF